MLKRLLIILVTLAVVLPVAICVVYGSGMLLGGMGDMAGEAVLTRIAQAGGVLWVLSLICLLLTIALIAIGNPEEPRDAK